MENITRGGGRLCGGKKGELYTKSGKKSVSLGNQTILSFEIRNLLSYTRIVQDSRVVMFQVCLPFFVLYEKHLKYSFSISLQLNSLKFPDLVLQSTTQFQVRGCLAISWQ